MEKFYEKKVEGIIVKSRARWHEYGKKNSKYFYNLEKGNHIKKHIRKLRLSGVITTHKIIMRTFTIADGKFQSNMLRVFAIMIYQFLHYHLIIESLEKDLLP